MAVEQTSPKTIGIGVIGMGWMGLVHSRCHRAMSDRFCDEGIQARLAHCADDVEARAVEGRDRFDFERCSTDWHAVIDDANVEAVVITAPNHMHAEIATAAAAAGKHIFCEKPVGRNPQETAQIEQAARQAGVLTGVGFNYRWAPVVMYARQLIRDGRLGDITHYRGRFFADYGSNPDGVLSWRFQRQYAGLGTLGDLMAHVVDMAHNLAGPIKRVVSRPRTFITQRPIATAGEGTHFSVNPDAPREVVTNEDYVGALADFENGAVATFESCRVAKGTAAELVFEINGTKGEIRWNYERMNECTLHLSEGSSEHDGPTRIQANPNHPFFGNFYPGIGNAMGYEDLKMIEAFHFLKSVADGKQMEPGFAEMLAVARVNGAMARSWDSGTWEDVRDIDM